MTFFVSGEWNIHLFMKQHLSKFVIWVNREVKLDNWKELIKFNDYVFCDVLIFLDSSRFDARWKCDTFFR